MSVGVQWEPMARPNLMFGRQRPATSPAATSPKGTSMRRLISQCFLGALFFAATSVAFSQTDYRVVPVTDGGTISGTVKWSGAVPRALDFPITKDPQICDPDSKKTVDLERLIIGPQGGIANTVVYLKNISGGKPMDLPEQRRHLDQKHCRYIPHILLVPENGNLSMMSSDATLHTIHMDGAATFNLPFPFADRPPRAPCPHPDSSTCAAMAAMSG